MKIGFLSDLHITNNTDKIEQAVESVAEVCNKAEISKLFIAGDISNNYNITLKFVDLLAKVGIDTYTVFGNHEYWSICYDESKLLKHNKYINGKSVEINEETVVIGIDGFFDYSFVLNVDNIYTRHLPKNKTILNKGGRQHFDLKRNKIGNTVEIYDEIFNDMMLKLESQLKKHEFKRIFMLTHYVPSKDFIIYNDDRSWGINNAFMGSTKYQELAEKYKVNKVIFGHTHNQYNKTINGVDYHCNPVGYGGFEYVGSFRDRVAKQLRVFDV